MNIRRISTFGLGLALAAAIGGASIGVANAGTAAIPSAPGQVVVINAATDKDSAIDALKLYQNATDRTFVPDSAAPTYGQSDWAPVKDKDGQTAPSVTGNAKTGQSATERLDVKHETESSWSLGGSIEMSVGFDLAKTVDAELSVKFTANHTWTSSTTDSEGIWVTANPGKTVWIEASASTASYTGNFFFTSGGTRYEVDNVTITQPAAADSDQLSATSYRVMQVDSATQAGLPADTTGGVKSIDSLPKLAQFIGSGH